jgi:glycosyltransferase involved in cell wall biosynthesis
MKILLTADPELPVPPVLYGGIERVIASLVDELSKRGHTVGLVGHGESSVDVDKLFAWPGRDSRSKSATVQNVFTLRSAVKNFRPDVVHSFSRLWYLMGMLDSGIPRVMSYQREPTARTVTMARRLHGRRMHFTGCSRYIADHGLQRGGGSWSAIPNFVDLQKFTFSPAVPDDAPLVFLSRVEPIKGCHLAIEIAKKTGRRLIIAGNHETHGANGDYWTQRIAPEINKNRVEYVGPVNDLQKNELLGQAAAMLVPIQWNEPFGIVFAESLACGTPVISCATGALPEIVTEGVQGFLIDGLEAGCEAVERIGSIDRNLCRQQAESCFSSSVVADQYLGLYRKMVGG